MLFDVNIGTVYYFLSQSKFPLSRYRAPGVDFKHLSVLVGASTALLPAPIFIVFPSAVIKLLLRLRENLGSLEGEKANPS